MESFDNINNPNEFPEDIIQGNDPIATNLLKQIYSALKDKTPENLSLIESAWVQGIENAYRDKKKIDEIQLQLLLKQAVTILSDTSNWNIEDEDLYVALEKIIFLKSREENFQNFFGVMEDAISSVLQLDFTRKVPLSNFTKDSRNVFNYAALSLNMIIEKMESSVISKKAVNSFFSEIPGIALLITNKDYEIRFINELTEKLIEKQNEEVVNTNISEIIEDYIEVEKEFNRDGEVKNRLVHLIIKDRNSAKIPLFLSIPTQRKDSGEVDEIVHILQTKSITSDDEKVFNLTQEAQDKIAPINSALAITSILKRRFDDPESLELLGMLERSMNKLKTSSQQALLSIGVSQPETIERIELEEMISSIRESVCFIPGYKDVYLSTRISCEKEFYTFPRHLSSTLQNLIVNSIKFRDEKKPTRDVLITITDAANGINISVKDNGIGMKQENLEHIFERGFKVNKDSEGIGTGLYVAKESVNKLKGSIDAESEFGEGTQFKIYLPNLA